MTLLNYQSRDGALRFVLHVVPRTEHCICPRLTCGGVSSLMLHCPEHKVPELLTDDEFNVSVTVHQHTEMPHKRSHPERVTDEAIKWWNQQVGPVTLQQVLSKGRSNKNAEEARHCIIWAVWKVTGLSLPVLGTYFDRDHTTIMNSTRRAEALAGKYPLNSMLEALGVIL